MFGCRLAVGLVLIAALPAAADTIVSVAGTNAFGESNLNYVSWTQTSGFSNVSIAADLFVTTGTVAATAYLTTQVGAGTTVAQQVATTNFSISNTTAALTTLFTGLTLNAGTYYLVINPTGPNLANFEWQALNNPPVVVTAGGVTLNTEGAYFGVVPAYPPSANFGGKGNQFAFSVTGTAGVSVPALSAGAMVFTGVLLLLSGLLLVRKYARA
ncbi:MAG TPA: hypothetical protein VLY04_16020 [Bryobacteraceae bacterium]|nr:hypothetical protein [Bryobacteraceae bacterium]